MKTVVVESPSKAKTINKYLGKDYHVLASFGHVRDLPAKNGSVRPDEDFAITYEVDDDSKKHVTDIAKSLKKSDTLILATDPDREGEAISWHVLEALKESKAVGKDVTVQRVVFNEITKKAVTEAMTKPRAIDMDLVNAQQARRALDYLVGFTLSPVLWRKLPGAKSAGRVQSVALRLICERDEEIEKFISQEYWDIKALLTHPQQAVKTRLTHWQGEKLEKFSITTEAQAKSITDAVAAKQFAVASVEPKQVRRHPFAPFTTSTLQQEASRKLGFAAKKTMQLAQKLYEGIDIGGETTGLITYMRTDGVYVSADAITDTRKMVASSFGKNYLPESPRMYKVKTGNAQEAHEAIRPTDVTRTPEMVSDRLEKDMLRLYELIWKRMVASQMESAVFDQVIVDFNSTDKQATLRAVGSVMKFDGFLKLYREDKDDKDDEDEDEESRALPPLKVGEQLPVKEVLPEQHFTEPPPRFTEASLVKKLEELGIGRPSTYASIISVLQEREYVRLDKKRFIAEPRGRLVNAFLVSFFHRYVEYDFTANLEEKLDEISEGKMDWKQVLRDWWAGFIKDVDGTKELTVSTVIEAVDKLLAPFIFKPDASGKDPRVCPKCGEGRLGIKTGRYGVFLGCSKYPDCDYTKEISTGATAEEGEAANAAALMPDEKELGTHPGGEAVLLKKGPYGWYVQLGRKKKPKRTTLPKEYSPETVGLDIALGLLSLPREVGTHPESGKVIKASIGRFGPYLLHDEKYTSIKPGDDVLTIGMNRAVELIANKAAGIRGGGAAAEPLKILGEHPDDKKQVAVYKGPYGLYAKHGKTNASLPKGADPMAFTLEEALPLLEARANAPKKKFTRKKK